MDYHLSVLNITVGINLPTLYLGRAALKRYYMWHFSMQGLPANNVTIISRELLPHVFTFISTLLWRQLFSVALSVLVSSKENKTRLLTGTLLCAVRTFLPPTILWGNDSLACSSTKVSQK